MKFEICPKCKQLFLYVGHKYCLLCMNEQKKKTDNSVPVKDGVKIFTRKVKPQGFKALLAN